MMNRQQLVEALLAAGVPPQSFQIDGAHSNSPIPPDFWFLRPGSGGGWEVGGYERGNYNVAERFDSESDATAWLYRFLTRREPPS